MPLFCHCLKNFDAPGRQFVLAVPTEAKPAYNAIISSYLIDFKGVITLVKGGASRMESVAHAFAAIEEQPSKPEFVAIHDAARPLADAELLERCLSAARECGAAIAAHRVTDTIHVAQGDHADDACAAIASTPPRETLWAAETPQVFRTALYARALHDLDWRSNPPTDDASLVARLPGVQVRLVENSTPNPKITYRHDLLRYQN